MFNRKAKLADLEKKAGAAAIDDKARIDLQIDAATEHGESSPAAAG